jgi:predicted membrane channel-forming protein YqfA (hemolysin III family)
MANPRNRWVKIVIWVVVAMMVLTLMAALLPALS